MSGLGEALPLALAAAIYPPALIVLLLLIAGAQPRKLVGAYFAGAALVTVGVGVIGLALFDGASLTTQDSHDRSAGVYFVAALLLLALAAFTWRRQPRSPKPEEQAPGRITEWSRRATTSRRWAFVLGIAMYLPSPLYLLAIKTIADTGDGAASEFVAILICAACVMLFVEIPFFALFAWPDGVATGMQRFHDWIGRRAWRIVAVLALAGAVYAVTKALATLD